MDIERMKKLLTSGIEAGNRVKAVRKVIKTYKTQKQDLYDDTAEILKPSIEAQKEVKKSIDDQQDKLIEQLQKNQKAITQGMDNILESNLRAITFQQELPQAQAIEGPSDEPKKEPIQLNIENNFNKDDKIILNNLQLTKPKDLTQISPQKLLEEKKRAVELAKKLEVKKVRRKQMKQNNLIT